MKISAKLRPGIFPALILGLAFLESQAALAGAYSDRVNGYNQAREQQQEQEKEARIDEKFNAYNARTNRQNAAVLRYIDAFSQARATDIECSTYDSYTPTQKDEYVDDPMDGGRFHFVENPVTLSWRTPAGLPVVFRYNEIVSAHELAPAIGNCEFVIGNLACRVDSESQFKAKCVNPDGSPAALNRRNR